MGSKLNLIKPTAAILLAIGFGLFLVPMESRAQVPPLSPCTTPCWFDHSDELTGHQTDPTCSQEQPWRWKKIKCSKYVCAGPTTEPPTNFYWTVDILQTQGCFSSGAAISCPNNGCVREN